MLKLQEMQKIFFFFIFNFLLHISSNIVIIEIYDYLRINYFDEFYKNILDQ